MEPTNIILIGPPQSGKTTLIKKIIHASEKPLKGFWTEEVREKGHRIGFEIHTLHGLKEMFAHVGFQSDCHVGKYAVDISRFEAVALQAIEKEHAEQVIVIDEIGKMECHSDKFCQALLHTLDLPHKVLATIARHGSLFMEEIKEREDVILVPVNVHNRDGLVEEVCARLIG
ncbi:NTPase [bacterium]|nr:NTPase [bacterium]